MFWEKLQTVETCNLLWCSRAVVRGLHISARNTRLHNSVCCFNLQKKCDHLSLRNSKAAHSPATFVPLNNVTHFGGDPCQRSSSSANSIACFLTADSLEDGPWLSWTQVDNERGDLEACCLTFKGFGTCSLCLQSGLCRLYSCSSSRRIANGSASITDGSSYRQKQQWVWVKDKQWHCERY